MKVGDICTRSAFAVGEQEALAVAVRGMMARHFGAAIVVDTRKGIREPVGIVTDRDVLRGQFDRAADIHCLTVGDVMTTRPLVLDEDCDVATAIERMSARGVRRAPVVDASGDLVGVVSVDDLLPALTGQMADLARLIGNQSRRERPR